MINKIDFYKKKLNQYLSHRTRTGGSANYCIICSEDFDHFDSVVCVVDNDNVNKLKDFSLHIGCIKNSLECPDMKFDNGQKVNLSEFVLRSVLEDPVKATSYKEYTFTKEDLLVPWLDITEMLETMRLPKFERPRSKLTYEIMKSIIQSKKWDDPENVSKYGPISEWDTGHITDMSRLFEGATSFNEPLNWNTMKVTNMSYMFAGATSFNQPLNETG